jgi:hypothetical protein
MLPAGAAVAAAAEIFRKAAMAVQEVMPPITITTVWAAAAVVAEVMGAIGTLLTGRLITLTEPRSEAATAEPAAMAALVKTQ